MTDSLVEHEQQRLAAIRRYDVLDTPPDGAFDSITAMTAQLLDVPIAIVSIVDVDRIWFKSHHGLEAEQVDREPGLCASAILQDKPWQITDAAADPRTLTNSLVRGDFGFRFYLGVPLHTHDGYNLGTLCAIDKEPRRTTAKQLETMHDLAGLVMDQLELRLSARKVIGLEEAARQRAEELAASTQRLAETLQKSLESNRQIGTALGLIMAVYSIDNRAAFERLRTASQDMNIKLNTIAREIVERYNSGDEILGQPTNTALTGRC